MTQTELDFTSPQGYATPRAKPTRPRKGTQCARMLFALESGAYITPLTSWDVIGIPQPARRINDLRNLGWDIRTDIIKVKNRFNETCRVASYILEA